MDYGHWGAWKQESARGHLSLPQHEVFDAEAVAAAEGIKDAFDSTHAPYTQNLYVLLDNQETARQLQGCPRGSSQSVIQAFQELQMPGLDVLPDVMPSHLGKS